MSRKPCHEKTTIDVTAMASRNKVVWFIVSFVSIKVVNMKLALANTAPNKRISTPFADMPIGSVSFVENPTMFIKKSRFAGSRVRFQTANKIAVRGQRRWSSDSVGGRSCSPPPKIVRIAKGAPSRPNGYFASINLANHPAGFASGGFINAPISPKPKSNLDGPLLRNAKLFSNDMRFFSILICGEDFKIAAGSLFHIEKYSSPNKECNHGKGNWDETDWREPRLAVLMGEAVS